MFILFVNSAGLNKCWPELIAKQIIEQYYPFMGCFQHCDKPDLQGDSIGIEVTRAESAEHFLWEGNHSDYSKWNNRKHACIVSGDLKGQKHADDMMKKRLKNAVGQHFGNGFYEKSESIIPGLWMMTCSGDLMAYARPLILDAVNKKLKRLNSGDYKLFSKNGLFIFTSFPVKCGPCVSDIFFSIKQEMLKVSRRFDYVFICDDAGVDFLNYDVLRYSFTSVDNMSEFLQSCVYHDD